MTILKNLQPILIDRKFITEFRDVERAFIYQLFNDITWAYKAQGIPDDENNVIQISGKLYIKAPYSSLEDEFPYIKTGKIVSSMRYFAKHKYLLRKQLFKEKGDTSYWYAINFEEAKKNKKVFIFKV